MYATPNAAPGYGENGASIQAPNQSIIKLPVANAMIAKWIANSSGGGNMVPLYANLSSTIHADNGSVHDIFHNDPVFQKKNDPGAGVFASLNFVPVPKSCLSGDGQTFDFAKAERWFFDNYCFVGFAMEKINYQKNREKTQKSMLAIQVRGSQVTMYNSSAGVEFRARDKILISLPRLRSSNGKVIADLAKQPLGVRSEASRTKNGRVTACYKKRCAQVTEGQINQIVEVASDVKDRTLMDTLSEFEFGVVALRDAFNAIHALHASGDPANMVFESAIGTSDGRKAIFDLLHLLESQRKTLDERTVAVSLGTLKPGGKGQVSVL